MINFAQSFRGGALAAAMALAFAFSAAFAPAFAGRVDASSTTLQPSPQNPERTAKAKSPRFRGPALSYELSIPRPSTQILKVRMRIPSQLAKGRQTTAALPAWAPGSYLIRDFGKNIYRVEAQDDRGRKLPIWRSDKQHWQVQNRGRPFVLSYEVFANELSVRTSFVDNKMALLNGSSVFMYIPGQERRPAKVVINAPKGWQSYCALPRQGNTFDSPDYDTLVDSPILLGQGQRRTFVVDKTNFEYVLVAPSGTNADVDRLTQDAKILAKAFSEIMGPIDFGHYSFYTVLSPNARGGLEHLNSTAMLHSPFIFNTDKGYTRAQDLLAHEFFHAWNVKRIHDKKLGPFDYDREVYTDLLWFHEGFTETITARAMLRANNYTPKTFLEHLQKVWTIYIEHPGRDYSPISELSRMAWVKLYKRTTHHRNTVISYYLKGEIIGMCLDLILRKRAATKGKKANLETLFAQLWQQRDKKDRKRITAKEVIALANAQAGSDLSDFFERYVYGTEELPLPELLKSIGIDVSARKAWLDDKGQMIAEKRELAYYSGALMSGAKITAVENGSPARLARLMPGDELLAINDLRWQKGQSFEAQLARYPFGQTVKVSYFRNERLESTELRTVESPKREWIFKLREDSKLDPKLKALRDEWLLIRR